MSFSLASIHCLRTALTQYSMSILEYLELQRRSTCRFGDRLTVQVSDALDVAEVLDLLHSLSPAFPQTVSLQFYELARKEIGALILSDEHPNIVRCFAMEEDTEFVYLALERCRQSLADLVTGEGGSVFLVDEAKHPTPFCMQASRTLEAIRPLTGSSELSVLWQAVTG